MKLHEEFKLFETMWEAAERPEVNEYYVELRAYDKNTAEEYDDADNAAHTSEYGYWGTKEEIVSKLNQIAKTCDFSFVFIYDGDPYDNNCVFEASDADVKTDEEFDSPVIWKNSFITSAPFMQDFVEYSAAEQDKTVTESSEFATQSEDNFKKEFISFILKDHPERKAACEILYKFDFRSSNDDQFFLDIQNGVITLPQLPQSILKDKDFRYKWLLGQLCRALRKLTVFMRKMIELEDCLEDAEIDLR